MSFSPAISQISRRLLLGAAVAAGAVVMLALPASAHVTIGPDTAQAGGEGTFNVQVPNEEAAADTTRLDLYLPTDHPIASVAVQPVPGWSIKVTQSKLAKPITTDDGTVTQAISQVTWSGGKIAPHQFQQFALSLGPLPTDTPKLYFKALQTYTDPSGKTNVVRWIDVPASGAEPEHPAPSITLAKASAAPNGAQASSATGSSHAAKAGGGSGVATGLAVAGLVVSLAALGGVVVLARRPRGVTGGEA